MSVCTHTMHIFVYIFKRAPVYCPVYSSFVCEEDGLEAITE